MTNAIISCDEDYIIFKYLVEVVGFQKKNIKHIAQSSIDDYAKSLSSEHIKAAFFLVPYAGVFHAKTSAHGIQSVLPRGSPYVSVMSEAMLQLTGSGKFDRMN
ncbi:hypothetical protein PTKIN_Ptkin08bG0107000 [Pterospermum kingtungense]